MDACVAAGSPKDSYEVHVPTISNPTFYIRDYGLGLSTTAILGLFSTLGASTKRDSNDYIGAFGIGRMSALAYSSSFTVESFYENTHHTYLITIKDGIPSHVHLGSQPTTEPSGLKLSFTVETNDISKFNDEAKHFYKFLDHKPNINIDIPSLDYSISGPNWGITESWNTYILMGNVRYSLDTYKLNQSPPNGTVITVPIGSVSITPGRESLNYDSKTITYLDSAVSQLYADIDSHAQSDFLNCTTDWDLVLKYAAYYDKFRDVITTPTNLPSEFFITYSSLYYKPTQFKIATGSGAGPFKVDRDIYISPSNKYHFLVQDITKGLEAAYIKAYNELSKPRLTIIKPDSNTLSSIESLKLNAIPVLDSLGIPYSMLSEYTEVQEKQSRTYAKTPNSVFTQTSWTGSGISKSSNDIDLTSNTKTYYYLPMAGSKPTDDFSLVSATVEGLNLLSLFNFTFVPKKAIKLVQSDPNFILATDYLKSELPKHTFYTRLLSPFPDSVTTLARDISKVPIWFHNLITEIDQYYTAHTQHYRAELECVSSHYPLNIESFRFNKDELQEFKARFPLIGNVYSDYLEYYLSLEKLKHDQNPTNGLPSPPA